MARAIACWVAAVVAMGCSSKKELPPASESSKETPNQVIDAEPAATAGFTAVPLPDPKVTGFHFPEPEATIDGWTTANDQTSMTSHAWGIWTALTLESGQTFEGQNLRVFETWVTPDDLQSVTASAKKTLRNPRPLQELRQFQHRPKGVATLVDHGDATVMGFVKYDPTTAETVMTKKLLSAATLKTYISAGKVPAFPNAAISLKPLYVPLPKSAAVSGRYFKIDNWPGPPSKPKAFPSADWHQCVWIDIQEQGDGSGTGVDTKCASDGSSRTPASTFGLGRFVHFQMTAAAANERNMLLKARAKPAGLGDSSEGDYAVLVAMHVTTRETTRWTWTTFWWTPTPDAPSEPSSKTIAGLRPSQLVGAPRNYAHCVADMMESPPQPLTGGANTGESVYCYNPWLEARFGPDVLVDSVPGTYKGKPVKNNVGMQTNCMSCHAAANFNPDNVPNTPEYTGDRYVDLAAPNFKGTVQTDFLWSIADGAR